MSPKSRLLQAAAMGVIISAAIIGGVTLTQQSLFLSEIETTTIPFGTPTGTLSAQITDPPNVPEGVSNVYVSYSDVLVHASGIANDSGWYTVASSGTVDLMRLVNVSMTLGSATVSTGLFTLARFDIAKAWVTYSGANHTALVPLNEITVPISSGGVYVSLNGNVAFLIEITPTVVPYQNGTQTGFVLVPSAVGFPISSHAWNKGYQKTGTTVDINSTPLVTNTQSTQVEKIGIQNGALTPSSFDLTVKNIGNVDAKLTSISILAPNTGTGLGEMSGVSSFHTITAFQILSNGTVVQPGRYEEINPDSYLGYMLETGGSVSLSYSGPILSILPAEHMSGENSTVPSPIIPGLSYEIKVTTSIGTSAIAMLNATS